MPLYEYQCDQCSKVIEIMQKFSDEPLRECSSCGGSVQKLMSMTSFSLKGSGWYTTDYKRPTASASKPAEPPTAECSSAASTCAGGSCAT